MGNWRLYNKKCDFEGIGARLGVHPVLVKVMRNRDLLDEESMRKFLFSNTDELHDYSSMIDIDKAIDIIMEKIDEGAKIRIIGDYDVDGIMSTYILKKGLSMCEADVDYVIPHRIKDGYGISVSLIDEAYNDGIDTIITCDNGIAAVEAFDHALELGITCIITDHHEIPYEEDENGRRYIIPTVPAVVDPKREECIYPFKGICGAVVAFKVIECLWDAMGIVTDEIDELRELAGFATVCDVMELKDENRTLVKYTLKSLPHSHNIGMRALVKVCELEGKNISSHSIGFVLGPCINATGRLESANLSVDLLMCETIEDGLEVAKELKDLNEKRKQLTEEGLKQADEAIEQSGADDKVLVVYLPGLHESLAGIVAGRIKEKYYKPVFVVTDGKEGMKGSARSIPEYHIYDAMTEVKDVFSKYGGHAMAAGFSVKDGMLEEFRKRINENCRLEPQDFERKVVIDVALNMETVNMNLVEQLSLLEPFGNGNEKPVFAQKNICFISGKIIGKNANVGRFKVRTESGAVGEMLLFYDLGRFFDTINSKYGEGTSDRLLSGNNNNDIIMDVVYYPGINEYQGRKSLQFIMNDFV